MHLAIRISEVLQSIFAQLEQNNDLACCARVCDAWFNPAVDMLWEEIQELKPLMQILGNIAISSSRTWEFAETPTQAAWDRFYLYTSRVRRLYIKSWKLPHVTLAPGCEITCHPSPSTMDILFNAWSSLESPRPFPKLESLGRPGHPFQIHRGEVLASTTLIHSRLCHLRIQTSVSGSACDHEVNSFFDLVTQNGQNLKVLDLRGSSKGPLDFLFFTQFPSLEVLNLPYYLPITPDNLSQLSQVPHLTEMSVPTCDWQFGETHEYPTPFQALKVWDFGYLGGEGSQKLLSLEVHPPSVRVVKGSTYSNTAFENLVKFASTNIPKVEEISFEVGDILCSYHVKDLAALHHLRILRIDKVCEMKVTDEDIESIVKTVPRLESFTLGSNQPSSTRITLLSVHHLVKYCQDIGFIKLTFDACTYPEIAETSHTNNTSGDRKRLIIDVQRSRTDEAEPTAKWFHKCCSGFERVQVQRPWKPNHAVWSKVSSILQDMLA